MKLGDYDIWFLPCNNCGFDTAKASLNQKPRCWKCGRAIRRDYSDRELKNNHAVNVNKKVGDKCL